MTQKQIKEQAGRYAKYVEWSDEDQCFVGRCPELMLGGVHGNDGAAAVQNSINQELETHSRILRVSRVNSIRRISCDGHGQVIAEIESA